MSSNQSLSHTFWIMYIFNIVLIHSNNAPLIGILTIPFINGDDIDIQDDDGRNINNKYKTYIPTSYSLWIEGGGGRVIPILCNDTSVNIINTISKLNGLLLFSDRNSFCFRKINLILNYLKNNQIIIPLWSIDIAFQIMLIHSAKTTNIITQNIDYDKNHDNDNIFKLFSLNFTENADDSLLFDSDQNGINSNYSSIIYTKLWEKKLNIFNTNTLDRYFISLQNFENNDILNANFNVLAINNIKNIDIVSMIENFNLFWFGSQFNPTIVQYYHQYNDEQYENNHHIFDSIIVNQYFVEVFINLCRLINNNKMDIDQYNDKVLYNYNTKLIKFNQNQTYQQLYLF